MEINLNEIKSPADVRKMPESELKLLCEELRAALAKKLGAHGGHVGPNLGVVEATVALHYVFDTPKDKLVFDVSHQSYVHKMLTGRMEAFTDPARYNDVSGYTCPEESEYDLFEVGHTSTSISLAIGLAKARDLQNGQFNVVAFIGDASLGGGMALEALNFAPTLGSNIIVVVNDNQMSIAENHGELFTHLKALRDSNGTADNNIFKALGYEYIYVREGNNVEALVRAFSQAKDSPRAVLVHINTMKGNGLPVAEKYKERFHYGAPFDLATGAPLNPDNSKDYTDYFSEHMIERIQADKKIALLTAGTPGAMGFSEERRKACGNQFVDAGICEQDAVTIAAGMARGGLKPVMGVVATFLQRAYDQLSHDVAINNLPASFVTFYTGMFGMTDATHLGIFDLPLVLHIPNFRVLAPANVDEYLKMLDFAIDCKEYPVIVRTPGGATVTSPINNLPSDPTEWAIVREGDGSVAIVGTGCMLWNALKAADILENRGVKAAVIYPRCLSEITQASKEMLAGYKQVITVEDGIIDGGFGQSVATALATEATRVKVLGLKKEFLDRFSPSKVAVANNLSPEGIASQV